MAKLLLMRIASCTDLKLKSSTTKKFTLRRTQVLQFAMKCDLRSPTYDSEASLLGYAHSRRAEAARLRNKCYSAASNSSLHQCESQRHKRRNS
eukprot:2130419-Pleurochrysis_carterae.AAC.4